MIEAIYLLVGLLLILFAAEAFTNGIEVLGHRFSLSQAVVGSILAAVGTALPETVLPLISIFLHGGRYGKEIGIGAILGAPFMLSTLAFFLVGITVLINFIRHKRAFELNVEWKTMTRDLLFFLGMYSIAVISSFLPKATHPAIALLLLFCYGIYVYRTMRGESAEMHPAEGLYLGKIFKRPPELLQIITQIIVSVIIMVTGGRLFINSLESLSLSLGMDPMLFSLLLAPVATELPEKFNSVSWTWKGKDILATGNITGAMVFQATFPVSIGLMFTSWNLSFMALFSALLALCSTAIALGELLIRHKLSPSTIILGGVFYISYAVIIILR